MALMSGSPLRYSKNLWYLTLLSRSTSHHLKCARICSLRTYGSNHLLSVFQNHHNLQKYLHTSSSCKKSGNNSDNEQTRPLRLSSWRPIIWPSVIKTIRNWFLTLLIRGYMDSTYTTTSFLDGAEQAIAMVSDCLSNGNFEDIAELVDEQALEEAKNYLALLSIAQRSEVEVCKEDVFLRYIHEIGMIFDDKTDRKFVEITTVFQGMPGYKELKENPTNFKQQMSERGADLYICNYRFIREFTKGVDDDWKINRLNHFHPQEVAQETPPFTR